MRDSGPEISWPSTSQTHTPTRSFHVRMICYWPPGAWWTRVLGLSRMKLFRFWLMVAALQIYLCAEIFSMWLESFFNFSVLEVIKIKNLLKTFYNCLKSLKKLFRYVFVDWISFCFLEIVLRSLFGEKHVRNRRLFN